MKQTRIKCKIPNCDGCFVCKVKKKKDTKEAHESAMKSPMTYADVVRTP